jgi:hypothetical protein
MRFHPPWPLLKIDLKSQLAAEIDGIAVTTYPTAYESQ